MKFTMTPEQAHIEHLEDKIRLYEFRLNFIERLAELSKNARSKDFNNERLIKLLRLSDADFVDFANDFANGLSQLKENQK